MEKLVSSVRKPPLVAAIELEGLERQSSGWRERIAIHDQLGPVYLELNKPEDSRRVYPAIYDQAEASTAIREGARGGLALVLSSMGKHAEVISLYNNPQRPV